MKTWKIEYCPMPGFTTAVSVDADTVEAGRDYVTFYRDREIVAVLWNPVRVALASKEAE